MDTAWFFYSPIKTITNKIKKFLHDEIDENFISRRANIPLKAFNLKNGPHNVQLLRTEPNHKEKSIKECYANLNRQILRYIFIQNQYIQYTPWAEHLISCIDRLRSAGYGKPIYVFILTSTPEDSGMDYPTYDVAGTVGRSETMKVEHEETLELVRQKKAEHPISSEELAERGINIFMGSLWTCAKNKKKLQATDYEEIYIHTKVAVVDDAAFTVGSANLNVRSMALDSELNVLSEAKDVAFELRRKLFSQCSGMAGPEQFGDMENTFKKWIEMASSNSGFKKDGNPLTNQLLPFHVDRKPSAPVV